MIDYSVVIRTTGMAGEKYQKLLNSIANLSPKPKEIIIVLPEGYKKPLEQLGWETFYYAPKGMISQRLFGIKKCKTQYALICDDDVAFESNFVKTLHEPVLKGICQLSAGPLLSFLPEKGIGGFLDTIMGAGVPTIFHREMYCKILATSGYSYNRHIDTFSHIYMETESLPWTCFYGDVVSMRKIHLEDEIWLDSHGYAALDDQTMFYKAKLLGIKTVVVTNAVYQHLDAKTSTKNNRDAAMYSSSFNRIVFWHRFLYSEEKNIFKKIYLRICFAYRMIWAKVFNLQAFFRHRINKSEYQAFFKGYKDGWEYIHSASYEQLPKIKEERIK